MPSKNDHNAKDNSETIAIRFPLDDADADRVCVRSYVI